MPRESRATEPAPGTGIDRTTIRRLLQLTPEERIRLLVEEVRNLQKLEQLAKER